MFIMLFGVQHNYAIGEELQFATEVGNAKDRYMQSLFYKAQMYWATYLKILHKRQLEYPTTHFNHVTDITQI